MTTRGGTDVTKRTSAIVLATLLLLAGAFASSREQAAALGGDNVVTAAGAGVFPTGANYAGVQLSGGTFGVGVQTTSAGGATGDLEIQFNGTSLIGLDQTITIVGKMTAGTDNGNGTMTLTGDARVNMGDGTPWTNGVALVATLGPSGITMTLGGTALPTLPKSDGCISIE
jgi:hypothetical protein